MDNFIFMEIDGPNDLYHGDEDDLKARQEEIEEEMNESSDHE